MKPGQAPHSKKMLLTLGVVVATLILVHALASKFVVIDNTTVLLVAILVILPFLPLITKFKFMDFEAEIGKDEVKEIEKNLKATKTQPPPDPKADKELDEIQAAAPNDPTVAFLKIRIAIEKRLRSLLNTYQVALAPDRIFSVNTLLATLIDAQIIDKQLAEAAQNIINVANRAVHGESIQYADTQRMVELATQVIQSLDGLVIDRALSTAKRKPVSQEIIDAKAHAQYQVVAISPRKEKRFEKTYIMNQAELSAYLETYNKHSEFLVSISEIKK